MSIIVHEKIFRSIMVQYLYTRANFELAHKLNFRSELFVAIWEGMKSKRRTKRRAAPIVLLRTCLLRQLVVA